MRYLMSEHPDCRTNLRPLTYSGYIRPGKADMTDEFPEPRQERREKKREAAHEKMAKHGKSLAQVYRDAIMKRLGLGKKEPKS